MSFQIEQNIGKDPAIKDLSKSSIPPVPSGYRPLQVQENNEEIGQAAQQILRNSTLGDQILFTVDGEQYMGRSEPHYHPPPPVGINPSEYGNYPKPWGWHRGVTVFKSLLTDKPSLNYQPPRPTSGRLQILQRIDNIINDLDD